VPELLSPLRLVTPSGDESALVPERDHVVGRGRECDIVLSDGRVSRRHLRLEPTADGWLARDISSNGIWVDGTRSTVVPLVGKEVHIRLGAANGPTLTLIPPPPPPPPPHRPAAPDVSTEETVLAGHGGAPSQPPPPAPQAAQAAPGRPISIRPPAPAASAAPPASTQAPSPQAPSSQSVYLRTLPTFLWLAAVGFFLGALIALS